MKNQYHIEIKKCCASCQHREVQDDGSRLCRKAGLVDDFDSFRSPQAFIDYLYEIGIDNLPTRYSLSLAYSKTLNSYPEWTFIDVENASETLRRKNVVKQFLSAYGVAKRGIFNNIFNK